MKKSALVITSINSPESSALWAYGFECRQRNIPFYVIGDRKSPNDFHLAGCEYWPLEKQRALKCRLASLLPESHYARKNLGYLIALRNGAELIIETDDDNFPNDNFWDTFNKSETLKTCTISTSGWTNVYQFFSDREVWPRGYPLEMLKQNGLSFPECDEQTVTCPIQQGLADNNPDVDAIFRLTRQLPLNFQKNISIALGRGAWSPFNSQNTIWFKSVAPLMYLPSYCNFRLSDIWRSFIAQRILWVNDWHTLFFSPTVYQQRNHHDLLEDFNDEIPGYLHNRTIAKELEELELKPGTQALCANLIACYELFIEHGWVDHRERQLVEAWIEDIADDPPTEGSVTI
ncbi:MAG: DUF288 domain-containing protein [Desulfobulbaceae bacterium]|nr:MAG: DUF288 domain-containing protein [Desulfobulbaceae bacterium]